MKSIFSLLHGVDHHLLLFVGQDADGEAERVRAEATLDDYSVTTQVHVVNTGESALREAYGVSKPSAFLIRPDGHVAWRGAASLNDLAPYMNRFYVRRNEAGERVAAPKLEKVAA